MPDADPYGATLSLAPDAPGPPSPRSAPELADGRRWFLPVSIAGHPPTSPPDSARVIVPCHRPLDLGADLRP